LAQLATTRSKRVSMLFEELIQLLTPSEAWISAS